MNTLELSNLNYLDQPLQIRKLMSKLQIRLEDEMHNKLISIEKQIERKWRGYFEENDFSATTISKTEIKKHILNNKEDILIELKDSQKSIIKREVREQVENYQTDLDGKFNDFQKRILAKFENNLVDQ